MTVDVPDTRMYQPAGTRTVYIPVITGVPGPQRVVAGVDVGPTEMDIAVPAVDSLMYTIVSTVVDTCLAVPFANAALAVVAPLAVLVPLTKDGTAVWNVACPVCSKDAALRMPMFVPPPDMLGTSMPMLLVTVPVIVGFNTRKPTRLVTVPAVVVAVPLDSAFATKLFTLVTVQPALI